MLAKLVAWDSRVNSAEFAANVLGSVGPQVPHVDGGRTAREPDHNHGGRATILPSRRLSGLCPRLKLQNLRQAQAEDSGRADLQEVPTVNALAVRLSQRHGFGSFQNMTAA